MRKNERIKTINNYIMKAIKIYVVSTKTSTREIQARNKKEAKELFKNQLKEYYSGEKITVN